jgi:hypothetical protein
VIVHHAHGNLITWPSRAFDSVFRYLDSWPGVEGLLANADDAMALRDGMRRLIEDDELAAAARAAAASFAARFSWTACVADDQPLSGARLNCALARQHIAPTHRGALRNVPSRRTHRSRCGLVIPPFVERRIARNRVI